MADFDDRFGSPSLLQQTSTGFANGAQSQLDQAKWVANGMNGPAPAIYAGGSTYPLQAQDLQTYAAKHPSIFAPQPQPAAQDQSVQPQFLDTLHSALGFK